MDTEPWSWGVTWHLWTIDISANLARVIRTGRQSRILCSSDRFPHLVTLPRSFLGFRRLRCYMMRRIYCEGAERCWSSLLRMS